MMYDKFMVNQKLFSVREAVGRRYRDMVVRAGEDKSLIASLEAENICLRYKFAEEERRTKTVKVKYEDADKCSF